MDYLLLKAWEAALHFHFDRAQHLLGEIMPRVEPDPQLSNEARVLRGFINAVSGNVSHQAIDEINEAVHYFSTQRKYRSASRAWLISTWLYAQRGESNLVAESMRKQENLLNLIGSAHHVVRIHEFSRVHLFSQWSTAARKMIRNAADQNHANNTTFLRIYGFGSPRVLMGEDTTRSRAVYGNIGLKLLLYMLEKRIATLNELIDAIYPDTDPKVSRTRFHTAMSEFKKTINEPDWCVYSAVRGQYEIGEEFLYYYDTEEFNRLHDQMARVHSLPQQLILWLRMLELYDEFAVSLDGEVFDQLREFYRNRFEALREHIAGVMPDLKREAYIDPYWIDYLNKRLKLK
ncbi:MAG: hypothetical protein HC915_09095 [Anaerolineae bacterium]|nr:hypothetical protein [Anaerolineae bacterium]